MKILYITRGPFGVLGGAASYMIPTIAAKHHEVLVCSYHNPESPEKIVFTNPELRIVNIFNRKKFRTFINLYRVMIQFKPDVIHIFQSPNVLLYLQGIRIIDPAVRSVLDFRTQIISNEWKHKIKLRLRFFFSQFYSDHIFTQSIHTISSSLPFRFRKYSELPIGIDLPSIVRRKVPFNKVKNFIFVGLIAWQREIQLLIEAFSTLTDRGITLDIIGDGDEMERLQTLIAEKGYSNIRMLGGMAQSEVYKRLHKYDAGVAYVPYSYYRWAPSLKSLEYSAGGLPVLASDTEGHKDYMNRFGFRFQLFNNSVRGIRDAVISLSESDVSILEEVEINYQAVKRFDWRYIVDHDVQPVYRRLLGEKMFNPVRARQG